jgi:type I restriction enzyme S subunit
VSADWPTIALRDLCSIARGGSPRPIKNFITDDPNGINWIKIGDTKKGGRYIDSTMEKIKPEGIARSRFVEVGSFLLSNSMSFGRPYILRTSGCIHDGWLVLEPDYERVNQDFLYHVLGSRTVFDQFDRLAAGSTVRNLNIGLVEGVEIPLPPLEEQQRIVAVLDDAFEGLARARVHAEANLQNAGELFAVTIEASLQRAGGVPITLAEMLERKWITSHLDGNHGSSYPRKEEFVSEGIPYISANCIDGDVIDLGRSKFLSPERADTLRKGVAQNRDVIFAHNATVGPVALLTTDEPRIILSTSLTYYRCDESKISPEFLVFEMRSAGFKRQYEAVMEQATRNQVPITMQRTFTHIVPPMDEQLKIAKSGVQIENDARDLERHYKQKLQDLDDLRQSLLQKAFAGELT